MRPFRRSRTTSRRPLQGIRLLALAAGVAGLLLYRLVGLAPALAPSEQPVVSPHAILHGIVNNPLYLPIELLRFIVSLTPFHGTFSARLPSIVLGCLLLIVFTLLVRVWYGARSAFFGLVLLATAPWFLHISRLALNDILYPLAITTLLLFYSVWQRSDSDRWAWLSPIINGLLLYIPGGIWFVLLGFIWQWPEHKNAWRHLKLRWHLPWLLLWPIILSLLVYSLRQSPHLVYSWAGLPAHLPQPMTVLRHVAITWMHILARGPQPPLLGLGYLPLVNIFTTAMAIVGSLFYITHWRASRSQALLVYALIGTLLASIGGPVTISILMPFLFILAAGGIGYLLHEWQKVFPRNPLAKACGYSLVGIALAFAVFYNLHQYFVAWPHAAITHAAFKQHP